MNDIASTADHVPSVDTPATVIDFRDTQTRSNGFCSGHVSSHNFSVDWIDATEQIDYETGSGDELLLLITKGGLSFNDGPANYSASASSAVILGAGDWKFAVQAGSEFTVLKSIRKPSSSAEGSGVKPVGAAYIRRTDAGRVQILPISEVRASADRPRLKMLQTATLSINWVEYDGPRDRSQLSPHAHTDFEQGSLALAGNFAHHLRTQWGPDAATWKRDVHVAVGSPSLIVVPVKTIHTSEGIGQGRHLLVDIFSPPREDFIANGWVFNSADYRRPS